MKLHRIVLRDFRGVEHAEVAFDVDGVTIVEGDNEVGKSCIPEALALVLDSLDSSRTKQIKAVQPVDRDAGPEVEAEISTGDYHFVVTKRWLQKPATTLAVLRPRREQLTGREAHERVEAILAETLDADLWNALNVQQGSALDIPAFNVPALGRALDAASGGSISTANDDTLWERIEAERAQYWTPGGKPIATREARRKRLEELAEQASAVGTIIGQTEVDVAEVERLARLLPELESRLVGAEEHAATLDERRRAAAQATAALDAAQAGLAAATAAFDVADGKVDDRSALIAEVDTAAQLVGDLEAARAAAAPARVAAETRRAELRESVDTLRTTRDACDVALRLAQRDAEALRRRDEIEQTRLRLDQARGAHDRLRAAEETLERVRVSATSLAEIEGLHLASVTADAALGASAATLQIEAVADTRLVIDDTDIDLDAGGTHEQSVPGSVRVDVPGMLQITVTAAASALDLGADAAAARERYERACAEVDAPDVGAARALLAERNAADVDAASARQALRDALRDSTIEALASSIAALETRAAEYDAERAAASPDQPLPSTVGDAQTIVSEAGDALDACSTRLADAQADLERADDALRQIEIDAATSASTLQSARTDLDRLAQRLAEAREREDDERLAAAAVTAADHVAACEQVVADADRAVGEADPALLAELLDNATAATKRLIAEIDSAKQARTEAMTRIAVRGDEGLQQQLDDVLTERAHVEYEYESIERRAEAARLLRDVASAARDTIRQRYHEPFRRQIERLGGVLLGESFEVELDDDLRIATRTLDGVTLEFAQLSAGAREQLGIISRLACASIVSAQGGAPVLLDDTLGWTDPTRLGAMGAIIAVAGRQCQVIVLTCTPGRYSSIGNADIVRLTKSGARVADSARNGENDVGDELGDSLG
ncbi:MAG: AAA family ATPase [Ilumatobacter sp.]|uniref:AAA family ATPase n=1 Tax=Ilumatobacter sp. TaxID=1967498 RepID=UPI00391D937E